MSNFIKRSDDTAGKIMFALENAMHEQGVDLSSMMSGVVYWLSVSDILSGSHDKEGLLDYIRVVYDDIQHKYNVLEE